MPSTPDKLFRDHLEHFKKSPPPSSWSRIESGLKPKKSNRLWISIAATVLVLLSASFLFWHPAKTTGNVPLATTDHAVKNEIPPLTSVAPVSEQLPSTSDKTSTNIHSASQKSRPDLKEKPSITNQTADVAEIIADVPEEKTMDENETIENNASPSNMESVVVDDTPSTTSNRSKKITYSSGEVNSRFLKKDSATSAPAVEKTPSSIQKIRDIAADLKDEASFGELRQMKNEILSFPIKELTKDK